MVYSISKTVDKERAYFTIKWSKLRKADKYDIIKTVPAMAGIFELYYMDEKKKLVPFSMSKVWIGGLRSRIRRLTDPELELNLQKRHILNTYDCYYRYSLSDHQDDLDDVFYFFAERLTSKGGNADPSGRFREIFVKELDGDKIVTI